MALDCSAFNITAAMHIAGNVFLANEVTATIYIAGNVFFASHIIVAIYGTVYVSRGEKIAAALFDIAVNFVASDIFMAYDISVNARVAIHIAKHFNLKKTSVRFVGVFWKSNIYRFVFSG